MSLPEIIHRPVVPKGVSFGQLLSGEFFSLLGKEGLFQKLNPKEALILEAPPAADLPIFGIANFSAPRFQGLSCIRRKVTIEVHP